MEETNQRTYFIGSLLLGFHIGQVMGVPVEVMRHKSNTPLLSNITELDIKRKEADAQAHKEKHLQRLVNDSSIASLGKGVHQTGTSATANVKCVKRSSK